MKLTAVIFFTAPDFVLSFMELFVQQHSIVRRIWGKADTILFIFAGSAAEFALNKAVDWLYFTGRLPADPLGRLFSTVSYAQKIVFSNLNDACKAIDAMSNIHAAIEKNRGEKIPAWAYRDVLFMLIHYSIAAYELLERKLSNEEKEEVFDVFYRVGKRMNLEDLPRSYTQWLQVREEHLQNNLERSHYSNDLYKQYKKHLGAFRFFILCEAQKMVAPKKVKELLRFNKFSLLSIAIPFYKLSRIFNADRFVKSLLLPDEYKKQISELDIVQ